MLVPVSPKSQLRPSRLHNIMRTIEISQDCPGLELDLEDVILRLQRLDERTDFAIPAGKLSIAIVDTATICQLHEAFLNDPSPTDVITFPGDDDNELAGEIIVCGDTAREQSREYGTGLSDELQLYLVHGWLHLAGLRDDTEAASATMRKGEQALMEFLRTAHFARQVLPS